MKNAAYFFITAIGVILTLSYGQNLIIPILFALLLWFFVKKIREIIDRVPFFKKNFPSWLKNVIPTLIILTVISLITEILLVNIRNLADNYPKYIDNISMVIKNINDQFNINLIDDFKTQVRDFNLAKLVSNVLQSLTDLLSNTFLIIIYTLFIFLEESNFSNKLKNVYTDKARYKNLNHILLNIEKSIANYIGVKSMTRISTGVLSYVALLIIGVDSALFWAFLIFLFNFIPTIGSIIATLFPAIFCLLQFGDIMPSIMVVIYVGAIQLIIGNILEPRFMGNSLNISPLVAITSLLVWGSIWGVTGMLLSIPITVIIVIIFAHFDSTKPIAIMLSEKGTID